MAGLSYEIVWSRYLGLFVGHSAYAQVLVIAVYLGGMAVGALLVADYSKRVARPLVWYARAELVLAATGLLFHPLFVGVTELSYDVLFPALGAGPLVGALRWGLSGSMILGQAVVLGATFPFMAAALLRRNPERGGAAVAEAYLLNTLGGAAGILLAGFVLFAWVGLPGTLIVAALLNLVAAGLAWSERSVDPESARPARAEPGREAESAARHGVEPAGVAPPSGVPSGLPATLFTVAFATALASFAYEIGWIRMLSLVLGSATHSFELMLSAFILGLALGAWWIRDRVDRSDDPVKLLGVVQVVMGLGALLSLPLYLLTYTAMAPLVRTLPDVTGGYALFSIARYALCLLVMLPATAAAGMTLPLITGALLRAGWGERSIGAIYGVNTIGSVVGVALAGLIAMPLVGLKGLLVGGAVIDVALGIWLLHLTARWKGVAPGEDVWRWSAASVMAVGAVVLGISPSLDLLTSGVFRYGSLPEAGSREVLFYEDGRTASVSTHLLRDEGLVVLSTNGKPDASLGSRWFTERPDSLPPMPIEAQRDYTTQVLAPLVALAHAPDAEAVAVIGHGSGMSGRAFLTSPSLDRLVTIEIEPEMVEGSMVFLPVNEAVFSDPRSTFVFDDAKSFLSYREGAFDIVFAEPSNPWVSGISGLFSTEFYERMERVVATGGVLAQWIHLYELDDDLVLGILAALEESFPWYRAYLVGPADIVVIASADRPLSEPDWSVLGEEDVTDMLSGTPPFVPVHLESAFLFDQSFVAPVLVSVTPNSDFRPVLDLGAERARFESSQAEGVLSTANDRIDLASAWAERSRPPRDYALVPARGLQPLVDDGHAAWIRAALREGGAVPPVQYPEWEQTLLQLRGFLSSLSQMPPMSRRDWLAWTQTFQSVEGYLHWGTTGWTEEGFFDAVEGMLEERGAPAEVRAAVDVLAGVNTFDWARVAEAADVLVAPVSSGEAWITPELLLDASVLAYAKTNRSIAARNALRLLGPATGRDPSNVRHRLLETLVEGGDPEW